MKDIYYENKGAQWGWTKGRNESGVRPRKEASGGAAKAGESSDAAASWFIVSDPASAYFRAYKVNREAEQLATDGKTDIAC